MIRCLAPRIGQTAFLVVGVSFITFLLLYILPADPARQIAGRSATPETVETIRKQLGLDLPFHQQYGRDLASLVQADLGSSYAQWTEVAERSSRRDCRRRFC